MIRLSSPGNASLPDASPHRRHQAAAQADLVPPLVLPALTLLIASAAAGCVLPVEPLVADQVRAEARHSSESGQSTPARRST